MGKTLFPKGWVQNTFGKDRWDVAREEATASMTKEDACPFCKALPGDDGPEVTGTHPGTDWVECNNCGVHGPDQKTYGRPRGAAMRALKAWRQFRVNP